MSTVIDARKNEFLDFWNIPRDTPEAEAAWEAKLALDARIGSCTAPAVHIFPEGFFDHITDKPIYIKSMKQLKEETRKRGLISHYAEGS